MVERESVLSTMEQENAKLREEVARLRAQSMKVSDLMTLSLNSWPSSPHLVSNRCRSPLSDEPHRTTPKGRIGVAHKHTHIVDP